MGLWNIKYDTFVYKLFYCVDFTLYSASDDGTVIIVVKQLTAALRATGSIPARNKYLYGLHVVVLGLTDCVCDFFMFVNAPKIQELLILSGNVLKKL